MQLKWHLKKLKGGEYNGKCIGIVYNAIYCNFWHRLSIDNQIGHKHQHKLYKTRGFLGWTESAF